MKILFLTRAYGQHAGGMERLSWEFVQAVSSQPGIEAQVIFHKGSRSASPLFNLLALPQALRAARQADVIHLGDPMLAFLGFVLKKLIGKPIAVTVHGLDIVYPNSLYQLYLKLFFRNLDLYFPISKHVANILRQHGGPAEMAGKFHILKPGVTDRFYDPNIVREQLAKLLNQDITSKKILFTSGRLVKRKGHEWFIREVLPKLPENVTYVIAGNGPEFLHLQGVAEGYSLEVGRVVLLGKVTNDQLKILYNTVDTFVMPNIPFKNDVEGFGLVLLEAALCNRPVFAANIEGIPDAIHSGQNGTLLPAENPQAWLQALKNIPISVNTRAYTLAHFNWPVQAAAIAKSLSAAVPGQSA